MLGLSGSAQGQAYDGTNDLRTTNTYSVSTEAKIASAWKATATLRACLNGGPVASLPYDGAFDPSALQIGNWSGTMQDSLNGNIKRISIFDKALTDAELQEITTL